jgi:hypothetical protein
MFQVKLSYDEYNTQFEREVEAFEAKREELLKKYEGKFVAFYKGEVIDFDNDKTALFQRVLDKYGYDTPIYFQQVLKEGIPVYDIPGIDID